MRSVIIFSCLILSCFGRQPTPADLQNFYNTYIQEARATVPRAAQKGSTPTPPLTAIERFRGQGFMLWDYLTNIGGIGETSYSDHFDSLTTLCVLNKFTKVIIFIKDPSANNFFEYNNTSDNSFIKKIQSLYTQMINIGVSDFKISVFFETGPFSTTAPAGSVPTVDAPNSQLANYFNDIQDQLDWAKAIISAVGTNAQGTNIISEVAFDPQASGANKSIKQLVINYADNYRGVNSLTYNLGFTLGVDESKQTYSNVVSFPVPTVYTAGNTNFPANPAPTWTRVSSTAPLVDAMYMQCYQTDFPAIFATDYNSSTGTHNGQEAANRFNRLLRDQYYLKGQGTITFTKDDTTITGTGTNFTSFADPVLFANDTTNNIPNRKIAVVESVTNNERLTSTNPVFSETNSPFLRTEITTAWTPLQPSLTQAAVNRIFWMVSVNYQSPLNFFGNWQLGDFMDFIQSLPTFNNDSKNGTQVFTGLTFPSRQFVIYNYDFATSIVQVQPLTNDGTRLVADPWNIAIVGEN
ncbi:MAG: hypothetical protein MRY21_08055 [Simkaniaceae bacterium]|nr:hypothetical protein [Simkaniaceae bacterium]